MRVGCLGGMGGGGIHVVVRKSVGVGGCVWSLCGFGIYILWHGGVRAGRVGGDVRVYSLGG